MRGSGPDEDGAVRAGIPLPVILAGIIVVVVGIYGYFGLTHRSMDTAPREMTIAPSLSPARRWQASAYTVVGTDGAVTRFEVRVTRSDERPEFGETVWRSYGVRPLALEWRGDDSLRVTVAEDPAYRAHGGTIESRDLHGVGIRTAIVAPAVSP